MANRETTAGAGGGSDRGGMEKAKDKAADLKDRTQEKVSHAAAEARDRGEELVHDGKEKAREMGHKASDMAKSRADQQKDRVSDGVRSVAGALRRGGRDLSDEHSQYGSFLNTVADKAEDLSRYLDDHNVDDITRQARRVARDHAPIFLSGAFTLGMIGARFMKSSGEKARDDWYEGPSDPYEPGYRRGTSRYVSPTDYGSYEPEELYSGPPAGTSTGTGMGSREYQGTSSVNDLERGTRSTRDVEERVRGGFQAGERGRATGGTQRDEHDRDRSGFTEPRRGNREEGGNEQG